MKLIFGFNSIPRIKTNNGIQYFSMKYTPFKIGDYIKLVDPFSIQHFGEQLVRGHHFEILDMYYSDEDNHILLKTTLTNNLICCSWVTPIDSMWKKL